MPNPPVNIMPNPKVENKVEENDTSKIDDLAGDIYQIILAKYPE